MDPTAAASLLTFAEDARDRMRALSDTSARAETGGGRAMILDEGIEFALG
jgi:hypothetical protein